MGAPETIFGRNNNPLMIDLLQIEQPGGAVIWRLLQTAAVWFSSAGNPGNISGQLEGNLYLNISSGEIWQLQNGSWVSISAGGGSGSGPNFQNPQPLQGVLDGNNASFSIPSAPNSNYVITVGGVIMTPLLDYSVSGLLVTFTSAPVARPILY